LFARRVRERRTGRESFVGWRARPGLLLLAAGDGGLCEIREEEKAGGDGRER
jgi:hypothetical protein